ncbi:DNA-binding protein inhibitor ID-4 isoform X2 [Onychostruthus taczanowskii]|uniref:DNA-binding protein inhibitor ID-4 isoform X2 n=1 Tax=Onychostruthus taczanowskii TaxID=356909 RepID=UPI001B80C2E4|nr:DNA-binding protein inhibitor ID-4 isoform X2 [Onychostruthus taczanowskii]
MERSVLWRGGKRGATPRYGTHGGCPAACPGTPGLPQRCGDPLDSVSPGASLSAPDGAMVVPGCVEQERVWAVWGGLRVVSPQLLICRVWLLRRQALLTSRGTASSAADRRSPGVRRRRAAQRQRGGRAAAGGARPCPAAPEEGAIQPPEQFPCFTPAEPSLFTILHVRSGPPFPSSPCPSPPLPPWFRLFSSFPASCERRRVPRWQREKLRLCPGIEDRA